MVVAVAVAIVDEREGMFLCSQRVRKRPRARGNESGLMSERE